MERAGIRVVAALAAAALVAVGAGCGGGGGDSGRLSKSEYEQKLNAEGDQLSRAFSAVQLENTNVNELSAKLTQLGGELDKSGTELENLQPPEDAQADNQKIADILHQLAGKFDELKPAIKARDLQKVQQLNQEVSAILQQGQAVAKDLKEKGYDVGELGGSS